MNLAAHLTATAARSGGRTALRHGDVAVTYRALDVASARMAALLARRGVGAGDRVAVVLPAVPALAIVVFGTLRAGGVVALLDERDVAAGLGERDLAARLRDLRAPLLVAWHAMAETADEAARRARTACLCVTPGEFERLLRAVPPDRSVRQRSDADVAVLAADGPLTHGELRAAATAFAIAGDDVIAAAPPLTERRGQIVLHAAVAVGACLSLPARARHLHSVP